MQKDLCLCVCICVYLLFILCSFFLDEVDVQNGLTFFCSYDSIINEN